MDYNLIKDIFSIHYLIMIIIERSSTLMDAKIDTLWARYSQNDQMDCFNFLKLSFFLSS